MKAILHILHLEDDPNDAELVQSTLEADGINCSTTCVQTHDEFVSVLEQGSVDLILSDFSLPYFDGLTAAQIAHQRWPSIPFIFVSGTLGEERAIDSLRSGATDYVLKGRLARLVPAVRRAMADVESRAETRRLEAQFIEGQKMDVLGQLAGGVAHDYGNILGIIMGYNDILSKALRPDSPLQRYTQSIREASEQGAGLTKQLLIFSRKEKVLPANLDLNTVVANLDKMLRRLVRENIEMTMELEIDAGCIKADTGYMGQVLMNLVVNARDAMPHGGKLVIATSRVSPLSQNGGPAGDFIMLSVRDTGTGMTPEVKARMFEAFFTTKPQGKGTGLGLATCQAIVKQSGGTIDVTSEVGVGTTIKIYFPRVELLPKRADNLLKNSPLARGTETVLVVEDDPNLRLLACSILEAQGYTVLSAANGQIALNMAREHTGSVIRLVVSDVIMPLMGGRAMAEQLHKTHPSLKVLFMSGYPNETITQNGLIENGVEFLPKPYMPESLARKVHELLNA
ncbi:MAG: response regulator [Verrucomicrobiota bacterium]|nr:response regulator [Verrucomicrobiota bacterium]